MKIMIEMFSAKGVYTHTRIHTLTHAHTHTHQTFNLTTQYFEKLLHILTKKVKMFNLLTSLTLIFPPMILIYRRGDYFVYRN